ncbi:hypothetical protein [Nocardia sp. XZ_19_369]|uniref:hypothetical protein n=1 Tax=Nocardia sp. XZ_19_369 TaxID=2769487 RepID=UPI0018903B1F|nr:hypothetical protein [Nocardia sp. XZ_19_369]
MSEQGKTYSAFIDNELRAEYQRRAAYDARAQSLVTSSGVLAALLSGAVAVIKTTAAPQISLPVTLSVGATLLILIAAAGCGAVAGWNKQYVVLDGQALKKFGADKWEDHEVDARNDVLDAMSDTLISLRNGTNFKADWAAYGLIVQVAAILSLGVVVVLLAISSL